MLSRLAIRLRRQDLIRRGKFAEFLLAENFFLGVLQQIAWIYHLSEIKMTTGISTILKLLMDTAFGAFTGFVRLLQSGVVSNWWGLACPAHCGSPSFGALLASFLLGFCSCLILCGLFAFWVLGLRDPLPASPSAEPRVNPRLSRYFQRKMEAAYVWLWL